MKSIIRSYEGLNVYKMAYQASLDVHKISLDFPEMELVLFRLRTSGFWLLSSSGAFRKPSKVQGDLCWRYRKCEC